MSLSPISSREPGRLYGFPCSWTVCRTGHRELERTAAPPIFARVLALEMTFPEPVNGTENGRSPGVPLGSGPSGSPNCYTTDPGWGERYTITEGTCPCAPGVPHPVLGSPYPPPGEDISQCQRLVKRKDIIYLKSYTNLRVVT